MPGTYRSLCNQATYTTATSYAVNGASEEQPERARHSTRGVSRKYVKRSAEMLRYPVDDCTQVVQIIDGN